MTVFFAWLVGSAAKNGMPGLIMTEWMNKAQKVDNLRFPWLLKNVFQDWSARQGALKRVEYEDPLQELAWKEGLDHWSSVYCFIYVWAQKILQARLIERITLDGIQPVSRTDGRTTWTHQATNGIEQVTKQTDRHTVRIYQTDTRAAAQFSFLSRSKLSQWVLKGLRSIELIFAFHVTEKIDLIKQPVE